MKHRITGIVGLFLLVPIGVAMVTGTLRLDASLARLLGLVAVLLVFDRLLVPLAIVVIGEPARRDHSGDDDGAET